MGRGRAKAKQARIARELKYFSPPTDLAALQQELRGDPHSDDELTGASFRPGESDDDPVQ